MSARTPAISGDLALVGLFDLTHLMILNGATGCLALSHEGARAYLWFEAGRVVNAVDDTHREGESAAYRVFTWKVGRFEFRPEAPGGAHTIDCSTEALMLEAARLMDESSESAGGPGTESERLREHQIAIDALREAFDRLGHEAASSHGRGAAVQGPPVDALVRPGDRLLLRPGHPARLRLLGEWHEARDAALSPTDYLEIKARLMGHERSAADASAAAVDRAVAELPGGRAIEVTRVSRGAQEALWLRPVGLPPPDPGELEGPLDRLLEIIEMEPGVTLFCAPDPESASRLLHAVLARLLPHHDAALMLAAEVFPFAHREGAGVVIEAPIAQLGSALAGVAPETLVLDDGGALPCGWLARVDGIQRLLVRVVATEGDRALARWHARLHAADRERLEALFGVSPRALALAHPVSRGEPRIPFTLCRYEPGARLSAVSFQTSGSAFGRPEVRRPAPGPA